MSAARRMSPREGGFTLIEALVALVILAVGATALLGAVEAHVRRVAALEASAAANWVAANALAETRLAGGAVSAAPREETMLGRAWRVETAAAPTDDPDLVALRVTVTSVDSDAPGAILDGFVDIGAPR